MDFVKENVRRGLLLLPPTFAVQIKFLLGYLRSALSAQSIWTLAQDTDTFRLLDYTYIQSLTIG